MNQELFLENIVDINTTLHDKSKLDYSALALKYPYCFPIQYLHAIQKNTVSNDISFLALYAENPLFMPSLLKKLNKAAIQTHFETTLHIEENKEVVVEEEIHVDENILSPELENTSTKNQLNTQNIYELTAEELETQKNNIIVEEIVNSKQVDNEVIVETQEEEILQEDKHLMVMMSFTDWLNFYKNKTQHEQQEEDEKKKLRAAWQKEKLSTALDDDEDEIPESIFKQAMESISYENNIISEPLAEILAKQGKNDKAIRMYEKLSLRNPEKISYFAERIKELNTNFQ